jgi:hypothetical protein
MSRFGYVLATFAKIAAVDASDGANPSAAGSNCHGSGSRQGCRKWEGDESFHLALYSFEI